MKIILLALSFLVTANAQFDSLIFSKYLNLNYASQNIYPLGDQNGDGFDDIMIYDCNDKRGYIFFGGNPMETIAVNSIQFFDSVNIGGSIVIIDLNDDNRNDIVAGSIIMSDTGYAHIGPIRVYYGKEMINTIPDLIFNPPQGAGGAFFQALKDFNGDGRRELVLYDPFLPNSQKQFGTLYFYNTESHFDTIPHFILRGDSVNLIRLTKISSSGDINGDGKTDFTLLGSKGEFPSNLLFRSFYLGNENFDLEPASTYYQYEHSFNCEQMKIINDINGDNKDDIIIMDYGFYPYYYQNAILYGSFPIDTIPEVGLNTQYLGLNLWETYSLGDVNGDGFNDFFGNNYASYPDVKLWVGGREMPYTSDDQANKTWFGTSEGFGRIISNVGDLDGDSVNDIIIGEEPYGDPTYCKLSRLYIFKGDTSVIGDTGSVGIVNEKNIIKDYYLYEPYPNPFNPLTTIRFDLPERTDIELSVYNILGQKIATLIDNETKNPGRYEVNFNGNSLSSGVYLYRLTTNNFSQSRKMLLIK